MNYGTGDVPSSVAIGDLNGDDNLDLAVATQVWLSPVVRGNVSVLLGNGDGTFQPAVQYRVDGVGENPSSLAIGDLDGDDNLDLAVANGYGGTVSVLLGNGDGTFQVAVNYGAGDGPSSVAIGDLDGDDYPDLAVANGDFYSYTVSVLLGNGDGTFQDAVNYGAGDAPSSVAIGDLDGDDYPDLAVANNGDYNVSVLINTGGAENQPPVAQCQNVNVPTDLATCAAVAASVDNGSFDPDGDPITLEQTPPGPYDLGDTVVTLTVADDKDATDECTATVTVVDQEAPFISSVSASPNVLWPPNHKMVPVVLAVDATDNCAQQPPCKISSVSSNEPVGKTAPDWEMGNLTVNLRAERYGKGHGRIYTITVECTDQSGNRSTDTAKVTVPHDKGKRRERRKAKRKVRSKLELSELTSRMIGGRGSIAPAFFCLR